MQNYLSANILLIISEAIVLLGLLITVIFMQLKITKQKRALIDSELTLTNLTSILQHQTTVSISNKNLIRQLLITRYKQISNVYESYFQSCDNTIDKQRIYLEIKRQIDLLRSDNFVNELEQIINNCECGIISNMRHEIKNITEIDIRIIIYLSVGFRAKAICTFLDLSPSNLYARRSRLLKKIVDSNYTARNQFLEFLNRL